MALELKVSQFLHPKPHGSEARRIRLTEPACEKIKPGEKVLDHQVGSYAIGLTRTSYGRARVAFWAKVDVPAATRQRSQRTIERGLGK
jgi:hypothetical protein